MGVADVELLGALLPELAGGGFHHFEADALLAGGGEDTDAADGGHAGAGGVGEDLVGGAEEGEA